MSDGEEGGTKISKRNVQQIPNQMDNSNQQQMQQQQMQQQQQQQQMQQQQQQQRQMMMQQQQPPQMGSGKSQMENIINNQVPSYVKNGKNKKNFGFTLNDKNIKNSIIVIVIFILLNSKIIWKAISKMPMMGTMEPSILALIVNSIIAGIVFYILSTKFNK